MTTAILTIALLVTPPVQEVEQPSWHTPAPKASVVGVDIAAMGFPTYQEPLSTDVTTPPIAMPESTPVTGETTTQVSSEPIFTRTPIEAGLARLGELGATAWQLSRFECLAWYESRNNPWAISATNDHGLWQINRYYHAWRWRGRDIYDPAVNAEVAWSIFVESGFRPWSTRGLCGV